MQFSVHILISVTMQSFCTIFYCSLQILAKNLTLFNLQVYVSTSKEVKYSQDNKKKNKKWFSL